MPREAKKLVREGGLKDAEKFYILAFEGDLTEPKYFNDLRFSEHFNRSGKIETIPLKKKDRQGSDPISVKNLLIDAKKDFNFKTSDEFWLIIDRDHWEIIHKHNFDKLVLDCKKEANFHIALSNPCFEIWLVLHLTDLNTLSEKERDLLFQNSKINNSKNYIDQFLSELMGKGRGYKKRPDPRCFLPEIHTAIKNAKLIANPKDDYPKHLGSDVYKLVEKLVKPI